MATDVDARADDEEKGGSWEGTNLVTSGSKTFYELVFLLGQSLFFCLLFFFTLTDTKMAAKMKQVDAAAPVSYTHRDGGGVCAETSHHSCCSDLSVIHHVPWSNVLQSTQHPLAASKE